MEIITNSVFPVAGCRASRHDQAGRRLVSPHHVMALRQVHAPCGDLAANRRPGPS